MMDLSGLPRWRRALIPIAVNLTRASTTNGLNQYISTSTGAAFLYDANGNLTGDGSFSYTKTQENRLVQASGTNLRKTGRNLAL
ncbi:hypothetical protein LPB140_00185 [Sphingorhabdus lutea]|uniref:RHS repeat-associated core domain-containing protein n=1 Tax=Sphingorhabdus lutea TaxID=1913578 RepID=A0A1L3J8Q7_9SPHN|nr:hypothetical protein [Sphingorhabdus lutea]APG61519.1 hypothetical protein LPB140_00185 [Sphingorhabdus lutea]